MVSILSFKPGVVFFHTTMNEIQLLAVFYKYERASNDNKTLF